MLVKSPVLYSDDRLREILAEITLAHRPAVLLCLEFSYLTTLRVIDGGVLDEVRIPALELVPVDVDHVGVEARDDGECADQED